MGDGFENYVNQVYKVRELQRSYFEASAKARRTRNPEDYQRSKQLLKDSKEAEKTLDGLTDFFRNRA